MKDLPDEDKEVNGNVTETYDPETQETQVGSVVTQYDTTVASGTIANSRSTYTSNGNSAGNLANDNVVPAQQTPTVTGYNLYSTGVATSTLTPTAIRYDTLRQQVQQNAINNAGVRGYTNWDTDDGTGITIKEPNINNAEINIGKYLVVNTNAARFAESVIPTSSFNNITQISDNPRKPNYITNIQTTLKDIKDSSTGLQKAFDLNKTANFQSADNYGTLDGNHTNDNITRIVLNYHTTDYDDTKTRNFNVAESIYVKEHTVTSYMYNVQVHIEVDDNGTRNSETIVTKKTVTQPVQESKKTYNVQDDTTIFQVPGSVTTWAANGSGDTVNQAFLDQVVSICNSGSVVNYDTLKAAIQSGTGHAENGDEIAVGFNREGNDTYGEETAWTQKQKYQGYTVVNIAIDWPSGLEGVSVDEETTNTTADNGTEGKLWLHQEELNYWFGNMIYASNPDVEWRLKAKSKIVSQQVSTGILTNKSEMDKVGYGTYVGQVLNEAGSPATNSGGTNVHTITYNKIRWVVNPNGETVPYWNGSIVIRDAYRGDTDYSFNTYQGENYELELTDETYGPEAVEDNKDGYINEYYDVAFNVNDTTYKYNLNNNKSQYLWQAGDKNAYCSRFSRHGMYTPYKLTVTNAGNLGNLVTYSFNHVRTFNSDNRNISSISVGAPGNTGTSLAYIKKILRNNTGNVWSGWSTVVGNPIKTTTEFDGTEKEETPIFTEVVRMKALNPYTQTTLRYRTYFDITRDIQINGNTVFYDKNDSHTAYTTLPYKDITNYIKFLPFSYVTKGKTMEQANGYSSLVVHYVRCHALKYTAQDRNIAYAKAKIINNHKDDPLVKVNNGFPVTIGLANANGIIKAGTQGVTAHYGCIAQVMDNGANLTNNSWTQTYVQYYPEVVMTTSKKDIINNNPSGLNLQHILTLTMAEKQRKTEQTSLYMVSLQGNQKVQGVTYSESSLAGVQNAGGYTYLTNGSEFTLRINDESITANLYGYSLDVIDKDFDTQVNVPNNKHNANGKVTKGNANTSFEYNSIVNDNEDIRSIWGNDTNGSHNSDGLKSDFKKWVTTLMDINNFGVDADLTIGDNRTVDQAESLFIDYDNVKHYDGFSGSIGSITPAANSDATAEYAFPLVVMNGEIVKDQVYEQMICQIALDYSTVDYACTYDQAEELFENSGLKWAILDAIESNTDTTDTEKGAANKSDNPRDDVVGNGNWKYNTTLGNEVSLAYDKDNWYDEKIKTVLIRRYKWTDWHFNDIVLEDKIDIAQSDWSTSQLTNSGTTGQWYLNIFFNRKLENLGLNFEKKQIYAPNGLINNYYGQGTMKEAHDAGSVLLYSAYVHDWGSLKSDFKIQNTTSVNDFDY